MVKKICRLSVHGVKSIEATFFVRSNWAQTDGDSEFHRNCKGKEVKYSFEKNSIIP